MNKNLELVKMKRNVLKFHSKHQLVNDVVAQLQQINGLDNLKKDLEFLLYVANLVENADKIKDVEAKDMVLEVFKVLFPEMNNDQDLQFLGDAYDFLKANKRIKKLSFAFTTMCKAGSWLLKKL
jgi:hypothetical protein